MLDPWQQRRELLTRRHFFGRSSTGIGLAALAGLLSDDLLASGVEQVSTLPHFAPSVKRVIYLFMSGAPSQMDLFDYKPRLKELQGVELPDSVRMGQRLTGMTSGQGSFPVVPSVFKFERHGNSCLLYTSPSPRDS